MGKCDNDGFFGNYCRLNVLAVSALWPCLKMFKYVPVGTFRTFGPLVCKCGSHSLKDFYSQVIWYLYDSVAARLN